MALISVVVPIFNEQENLPELRRRMSAALDATGDSWELVLVNDGSPDAPPEMMAAYTELHRRGHAHSVEVWHAGVLAGGLYGVAVGGLFAAESMFTRVR